MVGNSNVFDGISVFGRIDSLLTDPWVSLKKIARFCFYFCLIVAVVTFAVGAFKIVSNVDEYTTLHDILAYTAEDYAYGVVKGYQWYVDGYTGKMLCKAALVVALASLGSIPLYAFGCMGEDISALSSNVANLKEMLSQKQEQDTTPN